MKKLVCECGHILQWHGYEGTVCVAPVEGGVCKCVEFVNAREHDKK